MWLRVFANTESAKPDEPAFAAMVDNPERVFSFENEKRQFEEYLREEFHALS